MPRSHSILRTAANEREGRQNRAWADGHPANVPSTEATLRDIPDAAGALGLQIQVLNASTSREIEAAFATLVREQADALFVAPEIYFLSRRVQLATLAAQIGFPRPITLARLSKSVG